MPNPLLFQPYTLRGLEVRNRLWVAPMCQYAVAERDGVPRDWHLQHIGGLARGGAGLVVIEATAVVAEGRISPEDLGLWNDEQEAAFSRLATIAHAHGAKIAVQLAHAGRKASTFKNWPGEPVGSVPHEAGGWATVAPSAVSFGEGYAEPRALTTAEIAGLVTAFADAADRAVRAGMDAVEIHAAHGYLLQEFLSPLSNRREDDYGGPLEHRARFTREAIQAIRHRHPELPIIVRLSGTEWVDGGFDVEDAATVSAWLAADGADLVHLSSAGNTPAAPIPVGPSYQVPLAARVREAGHLPTGAVGLITSAAQAEGVLATGQADIVYLGRPLLANPHLPLQWAAELRAPSAAGLVPPAYHRARF
ncbi:NADH:flavin oxidoreductase/NADH oxidase [Leucobacter albus]|uniref:NADH:flavin oxidoreductase/NADH oxidase n=1 Tax=Leucobacter albus TaxID=272210 RepID=A0ABW3TQA6_9MICO